MTTVFTPEHSPLDRIFAANSTYKIPAYQRPYSWEAVGKSDRDSQVIQIWEDLWNFFQDNQGTSKEYFLGSMVIIEHTAKLRTFDVIDGQQRLTTLLLLFAAMRCFLRQQRDNLGTVPDGNQQALQKWFDRAIQTLEQFLFNEEGLSLVPQIKLKIEKTVLADFNQVLHDALECKTDGGVGKLDEKYREVARRYFKNRDYFLERLKACFIPKGQSVMDEQSIRSFDEFFKFLGARVAIVLIKTTDFSTAYRIFEILNNRGLPLSNLDLLRNFVLEELAAAGTPEPDQAWEKLESQYVFTEDFIGRWTESINAAQPQASAFNDAKRLFETAYADSLTEKKIQVFYRDLEQNLFWYSLIAEEEQRIEDPSIRNIVTFIKLLSNERYSTDLLLALFRCRNYGGEQEPDILRFLRTYRTHALYVALLGRFSTPKVYEAMRKLNKRNLEEARKHFELDDKALSELHAFFDGKIEKNDHAKLLLAAYVWHHEETEEDVVSQHLSYDKSTLEHVIPQNPASGTNWIEDFDETFREEFTYRLGNMTLLTHSKNAANRNFDFSRKRKVYEKTKLPMTVRLAEQTKLTPEFFQKRHEEIVSILRSIFGKE